MSSVVTIIDESLTGETVQETQLEIKDLTLSVQELIEQRIQQEVQAYNDKAEYKFQGLIQPTAQEQKLNAAVSQVKKSEVDAEKQVYVALDAFKKNGFFILVDDEQVESLEQELTLKQTSRVSFIKLTPLVGG